MTDIAKTRLTSRGLQIGLFDSPDSIITDFRSRIQNAKHINDIDQILIDLNRYIQSDASNDNGEEIDALFPLIDQKIKTSRQGYLS